MGVKKMSWFKNAWQWLSDKITGLWNKKKNILIKTLADLLDKKVEDELTTFIQSQKNKISSRELARAIIKFIKEKILNKIINKIDDI